MDMACNNAGASGLFVQRHALYSNITYEFFDARKSRYRGR